MGKEIPMEPIITTREAEDDWLVVDNTDVDISLTDTATSSSSSKNLNQTTSSEPKGKSKKPTTQNDGEDAHTSATGINRVPLTDCNLCPPTAPTEDSMRKLMGEMTAHPSFLRRSYKLDAQHQSRPMFAPGSMRTEGGSQSSQTCHTSTSESLHLLEAATTSQSAQDGENDLVNSASWLSKPMSESLAQLRTAVSSRATESRGPLTTRHIRQPRVTLFPSAPLPQHMQPTIVHGKHGELEFPSPASIRAVMASEPKTLSEIMDTFKAFWPADPLAHIEWHAHMHGLLVSVAAVDPKTGLWKRKAP